MKKVIYLVLVVALVLGISFNGNVSAHRNMDINEQIIEATEATTVELGFSTTFEYSGDGPALCSEISDGIISIEKIEKSINVHEKIYNISLENEKISGYIQFVKNEGSNIVAVQIKATDKGKLDKIRNIMNSILIKKCIEPKYYEYTKYHIKDGEIKDLYSKINLILKNRGVKNIEGVALDNGYSIIAFENNGNFMQSMGKIIDINIAVLSYKSGNYLIIGTPEIMTAY